MPANPPVISELLQGTDRGGGGGFKIQDEPVAVSTSAVADSWNRTLGNAPSNAPCRWVGEGRRRLAQGRSAVSSSLVTAQSLNLNWLSREAAPHVHHQHVRVLYQELPRKIRTDAQQGPTSYLPRAAEMTGVGSSLDDLDPPARDEEGPDGPDIWNVLRYFIRANFDSDMRKADLQDMHPSETLHEVAVLRMCQRFFSSALEENGVCGYAAVAARCDDISRCTHLVQTDLISFVNSIAQDLPSSCCVKSGALSWVAGDHELYRRCYSKKSQTLHLFTVCHISDRLRCSARRLHLSLYPPPHPGSEAAIVRIPIPDGVGGGCSKIYRCTSLRQPWLNRVV
ncbi:hypothetical protein B0T21DRAFT_442385 [Apiosordaria backusii]|uniref:Uncharacterized protein n=1 Tax=Apiosordaria backusii TaxID=314023 RepID=A0AA40BKB8_9PEZI|nr:hypothetical protein B0T21DRAFT_442385 [Apiosordaria backusii]